MQILISKVVLEYIGSEQTGNFDDFVQAAIDIMDEELESAKSIIEQRIKAEYKSSERFEVSVI